jgi:phage shock protein A
LEGTGTTVAPSVGMTSMGIFSRLADIVNSNINSILDRAQDPEKIIRLIIQEMEDTLVEVRSSAVRTIAEKKEIERRAAALEREQEEWQRRAELAVTKGRDDLAKAALHAKARVAEAFSALQHQRQQIEEALTRQNEDISKLQAKLADAKTREKAIVARQKTAANRIKLRTHIYDERITDAFARFEQVERALDEVEGKVEAFDLGRGKTLADELAGLEAENGVDEELRALKERLGNRIHPQGGH